MSSFKKVTIIILSTVPPLLIAFLYYLNQDIQATIQEQANDLQGVFVCEDGDQLYEISINMDGEFRTRGDSFLCDSGYLSESTPLTKEYMIYNQDGEIIGLANLKNDTNSDISLNLGIQKLVFTKSKLRALNTTSRRIDRR